MESEDQARGFFHDDIEFYEMHTHPEGSHWILAAACMRQVAASLRHAEQENEI